MKLRHSAKVRLLAVWIVLSAAFCTSQSTPQTQTPDPAESANSRATSPTAPDKSADQPAAPNSHAENSPVQANSKKNQDPKEKQKIDRMFYVMPNYLTVDNQANVQPVSWKEKFAMAAKGSFDPYEFTIVGIVAGIHQAADNDPEFKQGWGAYAKRYGVAFADQVDGNVMVGGLYPTILKIDPRYYRMGKGSFMHRFGYAIDRILIARTDSGRHLFNVPEFAGNATAIAISNLYYPASERNFSSNLSDWGTQMSIDALGNELKEFWPDIHHYIQRKQAENMQKKQEKLQKQHQ